MTKTFVIAEFGSCHNREWSNAVAGVKAAVNAKCDAIKFQTYSAKTLYCKDTPDFGIYKNINELIKNIELPRSWQKDLKSLCDDEGIEFISTPFDEQAIDELFKLGVKRFKIGGFEATDLRFVKLVAETGLPIIFSAGIGCSREAAHQIVEWIHLINPTADVTILHCNNAYPTPYEDICLMNMRIMISDHLPFTKIGLSDHTEGIIVPPIAVSHGAVAIEKHFTLDRNMKGPDHAFAIEPDELEQMVKNIRIAENVMDYGFGLSTSEQKFKMAMRSVVSRVDLKAGDILTAENITTKRPFPDGAIPAWDYFKMFEKKINCDLEADRVLMKEYIDA